MSHAKRVVVTGGCGFIGSHLTERLLHDGHHVTVIDNLATGKTDNLKSVNNHAQLTILNHDITEIDAIRSHFKGIDWVFHLAALADIVPSIQHPEKYFSANVTGTFNVLQASREHNVKRFIYTASSSCYGIPDAYPTREEAPIRTEYPYALTKYLGEQLALHWGKIYQFPTVSLRLFNVYGPRARTSGQYGAVFGVFLAQRLAGKPLTVVGDGNQTRDFTYVSDVVEAFVKTAEGSLKNEIFNIGSGGTYPIKTLVKMLSDQYTTIPKRPGEPDCTWADITKVTEALAWKPTVSFETGVSKMIQHIDAWKDAPVWTPDSIKDATKDWFKYLGKSS